MEAIEAIAQLLAAEKDPAIRDTEAYAQAQAMIEGNSRLSDWYAREREFFSQQENLLDGVKLSAEARDRILHALKQEASTTSASADNMVIFPRRTVLAWAAAFVLLLAGVTFMFGLRLGEQRQYAAVQEDASFEAFRQFTVDQVDRGFMLDYRNGSAQNVVNWLAQDRGAVPHLSENLHGLPTMGCKVIGWNEHKVSLICFEQAKGETIHMFVVDRSAHDPIPGGPPSGIVTVDERATRCWQDKKRTYIMVGHDKGQPLRPNSI